MRLTKCIIFDFIVLAFLSPMAFAQTTSITLPTNDDTSAFEVTQEDGSTVLQAAGDGDVTASGAVNAQTISTSDDATIGGSVTATSFHGDGSALLNVRPIVAYIQGNFYYQLDPWDNSTSPNQVRTISITVPSAGIINLSATGTIDWESKNWDVYRAAIIRNDGSWGYSEESEYFRYMCIGTDYACADSSDQYSPIALSRNFTVSSGGTYTYTLYMDSYISSSWVAVHDVCLTAVYYPTSRAAIPKAAMEAEPVYKADRWTPRSTIANP